MDRRDVISVADNSRWTCSYDIDPGTGTVLRHRRSRPDDLLWGWADRCAGRQVVIFKRPADDHRVLRIGGTTIDLSDSIEPARMRYRSVGLASHLRLTTSQGTASASNLTPWRLFRRLFDPASDSIDDEFEDFLITVAGAVRTATPEKLAQDSWPFQRSD